MNNDQIEYHVTILHKCGNVNEVIFNNIELLNKFIEEINHAKYEMIQKIEKFTRHEFIYENNIIHKPLFFSLENVTESDCIGNNEYSYPIIDKSLRCVRRY